MTSTQSAGASVPGGSWPAFAAALARAFAIGLVLFVPIAAEAWWSTRASPPSSPIHSLAFDAVTPPHDDDALRAWIAGRPGASDVTVRRAGTRVEVRWLGPDLQPDEVPWPELAYPRHLDARVITATARFHLDLGVGYYASLLGLCANLGYLLLGWRRLRSGDSSRDLLARPTWRSLGLAAAAGLLLGGAMLVWAEVPTVGGTVAGALHGTLFWPAWARWSVLLLVPVVLPLAQEPFFRACEARAPIAVSAVFAVAQLLPVTFVPAFVAGWVFARLRRVTGSLWAPIVANGLFLAVGVSLPLLAFGPASVSGVPGAPR